MNTKQSIYQLMEDKSIEKEFYSMADDISLMESLRMNKNDLVNHYMKHRRQELMESDFITLEERYKKLKHINRNSYCSSCGVEVSAMKGNKCPFCASNVTSVS